jgi:hypothetical protein
MGVKPVSLEVNSRNSSYGLPVLIPCEMEEADDFLRNVIKYISQNLSISGKMTGEVITMFGWLWSCVYSDIIFRLDNGFPILFVYGNASGGKSTIIKWLLNVFGIDERAGYTHISNLNTGVGWSRKMSYYSSVPLSIDEMRKENSDIYPLLRSYYDRSPRTIGTKDSFGIRSQPIKATLILGGQDLISDPATAQRCIVVRFPDKGNGDRDMTVSYRWLESRKEDLSKIGYYWIKNYSQFTQQSITTGIKELSDAFKALRVPTRTAIIWAIAGFFGKKLAEQFYPDYNYLQFLQEAIMNDEKRQQETDTLTSFFEIVEGIQAQNSQGRILLTGDHIKVDGDYLYIWQSEVFRIVDKEIRGKDGESFTRRALLDLLRDKDYVEEVELRTSMGLSGVVRRTVKINLNKAPEVFQNIAAFAKL